MAVLKSNRNESQLQFLDTARDLEIFHLKKLCQISKAIYFFHYYRDSEAITIGVQQCQGCKQHFPFR